MRYPIHILTLMVLVALTGCTSYMKGNMALKSQDYAKASAHYQEHLEESPGDDMARSRLAYAQLMKGDQAGAITNYEKLEKPEPEDALYLGLAWFKAGKMDKAAKHWKSYGEDRAVLKRQAARLSTLAEMGASMVAAQKALNGAPEAPRTKVAVIPAKSQTRNDKALNAAMAAFMTNDLAHIKGADPASRMDVAMLAQAAPKSSPADMARFLNSESAASSFFSVEGDNLSAQVALYNADSGQELMAFPLSAPSDRFFETEKEALYAVVGTLGIEPDEEGQERFSKYPTKKFKALLDYGLGLVALDNGEFESAYEHFDRAVDLDRNFNTAKIMRYACPDAEDASFAQLKAAASELAKGETAGPAFKDLSSAMTKTLLRAVDQQERLDKIDAKGSKREGPDSDGGCHSCD